MDKILIVDRDEQFLENLARGLEKARQFHILLARSGREAISILKEQKISVAVLDAEIHDIDILDLLEYMTQNCPITPCIIMSDYGKPWFGKSLRQKSFLYHLSKPFDISALLSAIFVGLNLRDEGGHIRGMTMLSLLPIVEMLQKTCRMKVSAGAKNYGYLYFKDGILFDAHFGSLNGEAAAREIVTWHKIAIEMSELPRHRTRKRLKTGLMDIADYSWTLQKTNVLGNIGVSTGSADEPASGIEDDTAEDDIVLDRAFQQEIEDMIDIDEDVSEKAAAKAGEKDAGPTAILMVDSDSKQQAAIRKDFVGCVPAGLPSPKKDATASPEKQAAGSRLEGALKRCAIPLRAIKGYRGVAVLGPDGAILATDIGVEPIDFSSLAVEFNSFISRCNKTAAQGGFSQCTGVTLYTRKGIVIMMCADVYKQGNFHFIGVLAPNSNGYFMQVQLEKAVPTIQAAIKTDRSLSGRGMVSPVFGNTRASAAIGPY